MYVYINCLMKYKIYEQYLTIGTLDLLTALVAEPWTPAVRHGHAAEPRLAVVEHGACLAVHVNARLLTQTSGKRQHNAGHKH